MNQIVMYGAEWCPDCTRTKSFLDEHGIDYEYRNIEVDDAAVKVVEEINNGKRIIPTLNILGTAVTNPSVQELSRILGVNAVGRVELYGAEWCPDCKRAKSFLEQSHVHFQYINVDEFEWATELVEKINNGKRIIPTVLVNGEPHTNPDNGTLRDLLKIEQEVEEKTYDVAIVGAGAAGLTAAIYLQREHMSTVLLEKKTVGGNAFLTQEIANYPGFVNISGPDLMQRMREQAEVYGAEIRVGVEVESIEKQDCEFELATNDLPVCAKSVVLAMGSTYRTLGIPGEQELIGAGVHFCATCDGPFYKNKRVLVIGGGNSALEEGMYLSEFCSEVTIVHRKPAFSASKTYLDKLPDRDNMATAMNKTVQEFVANEQGQFKALKIKDNESGDEELLEADGVFIFIGLVPNTAFVKEFVDLDERGFVVTKADSVHTSQPGIFAAGDCRKHAIAQVAAATGEGVMASYAAKEFLRKREPGKSAERA